MDITLSAIIGSTIIIIVLIIFAIIRIQNLLKLTMSDEIKLVNSRLDQFEKDVNSLFHLQSETFKGIILENQKVFLQNGDSTKSEILDKLQSLNTLQSSIKTFQTMYQDTSKNQDSNITDKFNNLSQYLQDLKLDNWITLSNEIGKYKNGIDEDEHFIQEVGFCKILKLTDKSTNAITEVYYDENGNKELTKTYQDGFIKHSMSYSQDGNLIQGIDFDKEGREICIYNYNQAGEVSSKIEYSYDEEDNKIEKSRKTY